MDVRAPAVGLISNGRIMRLPSPTIPVMSPSIPKPLRTGPGWSAFTVTAAGSRRFASARVNRMFASFDCPYTSMTEYRRSRWRSSHFSPRQ